MLCCHLVAALQVVYGTLTECEVRVAISGYGQSGGVRGGVRTTLAASSGDISL